ncbi:acetyl-coenzyme A synthetase N-terminal domain-containing protein, partial [Cribrihabitans sp. XS_ASV171]
MPDARPILWTPSQDRIEKSRMAEFMRWLEADRGLHFGDYNALWRWSIEDLEGFWQAIWDFFDLRASVPHDRVLARRVMPGSEWFPGAQLNFSEQMLRQTEKTPNAPA